MRRTLLAIGILVLCGGVAALEYWHAPARAIPLKSSVVSGGTNIESGAPIFLQVPISQVSSKNFELAGIAGVIKKSSDQVNHLFGSVEINPTEDKLLVLKTDFFEEQSGKALVSIYEIFPTGDTTGLKAFLSLQKKLEDTFVTDPETSVNKSDEFGIHSLYFNPSTAPDRAFLLGVTTNRLIGFEYLKESHDRLLPLFTQLLPPAQNTAPAQKTGGN